MRKTAACSFRIPHSPWMRTFRSTPISPAKARSYASTCPMPESDRGKSTGMCFPHSALERPRAQRFLRVWPPIAEELGRESGRDSSNSGRIGFYDPRSGPGSDDFVPESFRDPRRSRKLWSRAKEVGRAAPDVHACGGPARALGRASPRPRRLVAVVQLGPTDGSMFWFMRKRFCGSNFALMAASLS